MKRPGFLPTFFIALGIVFTIAVILRIRSYRTADETGARRSAMSTVADTASVDAANEAVAVAEDPLAVIEGSPSPADYDAPPLLVDPAPFVTSRPSATAPAAIGSFSVMPRSRPPAEDAAVRAMPQPAPTKSAKSRPSTTSKATGSQQAQQQRSSSSVSESGTGSQNPAEPPAEDDPTSDSAAPRLTVIAFNPEQVADGEETMLIVEAIDDLSGIRSVSGTIIAPSGAVQGFAAQREGATNRYVSRVRVPVDAAEGLWSVNYLNLMDNASNAATLTSARGQLPPSASFRVLSSRPDSEGPVLDAVWIDRRAMKGGEKNLIFVRATDDNSGVHLISGIFHSPSRQARVGFVCRGGGNDGMWSCELTAPPCADCGEWQLEQLQMQDKANNMTTVRAGQSEKVAAVRVDITSELCDATPPSVETVALDTRMVSNVEQSAIGVIVTLGDDACGVLSVSGQASGPPPAEGAPPRLYFSFTPAGDPHTWNGKLVVQKLAAKGMWRVSFLQVLDRGQNLKTYTQNDPLLAGATFVVD